MGQIEQRKAVRVAVDVAAEVFTPQGVLPARTRNLSATGVCVDVSAELKEGTTVGLSLFITDDGIEDPDMEPLNVKANIVWCAQRDETEFSAGAYFQDMTEDNKSTLNDFLATLGL